MERLNQYLPRLVAKVKLQEELEDPAGFRDRYPSYWRGQRHPLQCSYLENPMGRGAWWAAVHGTVKSDMTERLHFHFSLSCTGEGNGNPLQCSYLENPWDSGAWRAAIYGVAQSQTQLKWLSSSIPLIMSVLFQKIGFGNKKYIFYWIPFSNVLVIVDCYYLIAHSKDFFHKEGKAPNHWHFPTVVLEKPLESPLESKKIKSVNPKGNQA